MKKKMINDKTIRAIAIGLSAVIATAQPMTAFAAEEIEPASEPTPQEAANPSAEQDAKSAIDNDKTVDAAISQMDKIEEKAEKYEEAFNEACFDDAKEAYAEKIDLVNEAVENIAEDLNAAKTDMGEASTELGKADAASKTVAEKKDAVAGVVTDIENATSAALAAANEADATIQGYVAEMEAATTVAAANEAYDKVVAEINLANENYDKANTEYKQMLDDYEAAKVAASNAAGAYVKALDDANGELESALANLTAAEKELAYSYSRDGAITDVDRKDISSQIWTARDYILGNSKEGKVLYSDTEVARLKTEVARTELLAEIEKKQAEVDKFKKSTSDYWRAADELVNDLILYTLYDNADVDMSKKVEFGKWVSEKGDDNCIQVTYKNAEGKSVVEYYDYISYDADGNVCGNGNSNKAVTITVVKKSLTDEGKFTGKGDDYLTQDQFKALKDTRVKAFEKLESELKALEKLNGKREGAYSSGDLNDKIAKYESVKANIANELRVEKETQQKNVEAAKAAVENIQRQIAALKLDYEEDSKEYASALLSYKSRLSNAEKNLEEAKDKLKELNDQAKEIESEIDDIIDRLTPAPTPAPNGGNTPNAPVAETPAEAILFVNDGTLGAAPAQAPAQAVLAGVQVAQANAGNAQAAGDVINLDAAQTPLADFAEEAKPSDAATITLEDEATPLVDFAEKENMNWWWLIVVTVLGATGVALYRKHQQKKAKAEAVEKK